MKVDLLAHNQEAYGKIKSLIADGRKKLAISHATGTGKSYLIAKLFEDYSNDKKLVLAPSRYIKEQMQGLFDKYSIQNVDIILYQKLIKMPDEDIAAMDYQVIALDEYHHDAATKVWGEKVELLINSHPESIIFGTSATPIKTDGVNAIDELFEGNCASDLPLSESIARKIVPLPKYVGALYTLDDELERLRKKVESATNSKEEKKEFYEKINVMRSQIEKSYGMPIILNKHIKDRKGRYIVFCKNKKHLAEIKDTVIGWFRTAGCKNINAYVVHSSYENKDAEYKAFCNDTSHNLKLLFSIDVLNEGLHLKNISGVLLLRPTRSSIVWHQQIGRAIEANNTNTPVIIDAVNNFSAVGQGMGLLKEIKDAITKEKEGDPEFDDSGFLDIDTFFVLENVIELQEMFKEIEGRLKGSWENGLKHFDKYIEEHNGDVLVPLRYRNKDGFLLGSWVSNNRNNFKNKKLSMDKIDELNKRGFVWDVLQYNFEINIKALTQYKEREGDCLVPGNHIEVVDGVNVNLGIWCQNLRMGKKGKQRYSLTKDRIEQLENLGFIWDMKVLNDLEWEYNFKKLFEYKNKHRHLYQIKDKKLSWWCSKIRDDIKNGKLEDWKVEKLKEIDFPFDPYKAYFEAGCRYYADYIKKYGRKTGVPNGYKTEDGFNLDSWINSQKNKYRRNKLSDIEKNRLKEVGFCLSVNNNNFDKKFNLLVEYMEVNHCDSKSIPQKIIYKGEKLGIFVNSMRAAYKSGSISKYRKEKLQSIGFIWSVFDQQWEDNLQWLRKYKDNHNGNINISKSDKSLKHHYEWLVEQRGLYRKGQMREDRKKLFEEVVVR